MHGRTHGIIGAGLAFPFAAAALHAAPIDAAVIEVSGTLAALMPDLDSPGSLIGRWFHLPLPHRGPTHWLLTAAAAGLGVGLIAEHFAPAFALTFALVVAMCWASHTVADLTNIMPVAVLPGVRWRIPYPLGAREGGWLSTIEETVTVLLVALLVAHVVLRLG